MRDPKNRQTKTPSRLDLMKRRFSEDGTIDKAIERFARNTKDWDQTANEIAISAILELYDAGHFSDVYTEQRLNVILDERTNKIKKKIDEEKADEVKSLKNEIKGLNMALGKLKKKEDNAE